MSEQRKAMIIAPFWRRPDHISVYRIDRFARWLSGKGVKVVLVRAGGREHIQDMPWGEEITVRDPLGLFEDPGEEGARVPFSRYINCLRRFLVFNVFRVLFNPDPMVAWARRAAANTLVKERMRDVAWVISSSPPESCHVASFLLSRTFGKELVIDMRDGWLDEPIKRYLEYPGLRHKRESRLEALILRGAKRIFVTSCEWKSLIEKRLPFTAGKITVLTNAYPPKYDQIKYTFDNRHASDEITLIYTGRFSGRGTRPGFEVEYLLKPVAETLASADYKKGKIILLGRGPFGRGDIVKIGAWRPAFEAAGWSIEVRKAMPREQMLAEIKRAHGLLLLALCEACIPSKLFEYIPAGRPFLAVVMDGNAVWNLCRHLPQAFLLDYSRPQEWTAVVNDFLTACSAEKHPFIIPDDFAEQKLSRIFMSNIGID
ncbi:MAG: hypothetical protein ABIH66_11800 [bacterium]